MQKLLAKLLRNLADEIDENRCGLKPEELENMATMILHIEYNAEQTCNYLGISRSSLNRLMADPLFPRPHKKPGEKIFWYRDELDKFRSKLNR